MYFLFLKWPHRSIIWVTYNWISTDKNLKGECLILYFYILHFNPSTQAMERQKLEQLNHATFCEAIRLKLERVMRTKQHCLGVGTQWLGSRKNIPHNFFVQKYFVGNKYLGGDHSSYSQTYSDSCTKLRYRVEKLAVFIINF